ncbi:hypothetical protein D1007_49326 [Hordeum vulgare]|nr:hypothetical protein D1007_49326 [Hordeum vulgare]
MEAGSSAMAGADDLDELMQQLGIEDTDLDDVVFEEECRPQRNLSLGDKLYTMQFSCLRDWDKVMEGGPWTFRGNPVLMAPYDGFTKPSTIDLNKLRIWAQIIDLPDGYEPLLKALAGKIGKFYSYAGYPGP